MFIHPDTVTRLRQEQNTLNEEYSRSLDTHASDVELKRLLEQIGQNDRMLKKAEVHIRIDVGSQPQPSMRHQPGGQIFPDCARRLAMFEVATSALAYRAIAYFVAG